MRSRYDDAEPLTDAFAEFCNARDYTTAEVQSDPELRARLEVEYQAESRSLITRMRDWCRRAGI